MNRPFVIGIGGYTSNVGKTTLLCELLQAFPGWEAIKTTRGHYRSCGKDPHACCVSHLLAAEPVVRSGRDKTYQLGKDTGRYWDAGASNVHWLIATDDQVGPGVREALSRVEAEGVFVEGNSFAQFVDVDLFVMVRRSDDAKIKKSAKQVLERADALYVSDADERDLLQLIERIRCLVREGAGRAVA
jgi:molybdopterin-guanine dinucleotide biosynthesis protein